MAAVKVESLVGVAQIPPEILAVASLSPVHYADLFSIATAGASGSAERWARAALEEAPTARRWARLAWHALGLRLAPRGTPGHVQGWAIAKSGANWVSFRSSSWFMATEALIKVKDGRAMLTLLIRYDHALAPVIWRPASALHRKGVPTLLTEAHSIVAGGSGVDRGAGGL